MPRRPAAVQVALLASAAALAAGFVAPGSAQAGEGSLPVRAGDTVRGTLRRCLDRHRVEVEMVRGDRFRMRVRALNVDGGLVQVRVHDPEGLPWTYDANVRMVGSEIAVGPFAAPLSGTWTFELTTAVAHGARYEATTALRPASGGRGVTRAITARREATVFAAAGSTILVRGRRLPSIAVTTPGAAAPVLLTSGSPELRALATAGLAAPRAGEYGFALGGDADGGGRAHGRATIRVRPPRRTSAQTVDFPSLPEEPTVVASWQGDAGWLVDPTRTAPDEEGYVPPPGPPVPATSPFSGSLRDDCPAPDVAPPDAAALADAATFTGPSSGVGLPAAGIPSVASVLSDGRLEPGAPGTAPSYVLVRTSAALGDVTTRVWFTVDGVPAPAPLMETGRLAIRWQDAGGTQNLSGAWTLTRDPLRGVDVLDGAEGRSPGSGRTIASAADGFALPATPGAWPTGRLSIGVVDPFLGADFVRTETFDGRDAVRVDVSWIR